MKLKPQILFILVLGGWFCLYATSSAQSFHERVIEVSERFRSTQLMALQIEITAYEAGIASPIFHQNALLVKENNNYFSQFNETDMQLGNRYSIAVDKTERRIVVNARTKDEVATDPWKGNLDSLVSNYTTPLLVARTDSSEQYRIEQQTATIKLINVWFRIPDTMLKKIDYTYSNGQRVTILYSEAKKAKELSKSFFDETRYVVFIDNKLVPAAKYKGYQVFDNVTGR